MINKVSGTKFVHFTLHITDYLDIGENSWLNVISLCTVSITSSFKGCPSILSNSDILEDLLKLFPIDLKFKTLLYQYYGQDDKRRPQRVVMLKNEPRDKEVRAGLPEGLALCLP